MAESQDPMLALARLVDARSRQIRRALEEQVGEPCCQAYAVLWQIQAQALDGGESYPDATDSLRLSFGKVHAGADSKQALGWRTDVTTLGDLFRYAQESRQDDRLPKNWLAAKDKLDEKAPLIFSNSADVAPGNSGSPVVNRQGELIGVTAWAANMINQLAYLDDESSGGAVAARGILEVLDKVYHANELVKELGGNANESATKSAQGRVLPAPASVLPAGLFPSTPAIPASPLPPLPQIPQAPPANPFPLLKAFQIPAPIDLPSLVAAEKQASLAKQHKDLIPALITALKDRDQEVANSAASALVHLGEDAQPALVEALQVKDNMLRARAASALGKMRMVSEKAVAALINALEDEDVEVRRQAARALTAVVQERSPASEGPRRP